MFSNEPPSKKMEAAPLSNGVRSLSTKKRGAAEGPHPPTQQQATSTSGRGSDAESYKLEDFEELQIIGSGSSGVVKKVRHRQTGEIYVLKVIQFDANSEQLRKNVQIELRTLYGASHPHIVKYYQSFFTGDIAILMEHMNKCSLADTLKQLRRIPEKYLAQIARQVLLGLGYLHTELRVVHRDIKPSNLLLNSAGELKITDFGVSGQLASSVSKCVSFVGTVTYMSPERIKGESYSFASDIWSLGLSLVECAMGRFPYPPPSVTGTAPLGFWELLEYIVVEPAPQLPPAQFSKEFCGFVGLCLQKEPGKRATIPQLLEHPFIKKQPKTSLADLFR